VENARWFVEERLARGGSRYQRKKWNDIKYIRIENCDTRRKVLKALPSAQLVDKGGRSARRRSAPSTVWYSAVECSVYHLARFDDDRAAASEGAGSPRIPRYEASDRQDNVRFFFVLER
jgi:Fe-S-cluster formation regulator IscX/YfhJ